MPGINLAQQLKHYVQSMHDQGILDHNYDHLRSLQQADNPHLVNDVLSIFFSDAPDYIARITGLISSEDVDYVKLKNVVHQLKGCGSVIGGQRMTLACYQFQTACDERDKERCLDMLERVKREFNTLEECFNNITQMERDIDQIETRRRRSARRRT
ncbi:histidine-containing phosphotransfer factor 5 [Hibiscus trionum]|uniref:Histidine-containing phosphotransfer protein n=1 Tax=Hibiscus trionum TaxID=183268 RepID=A0A9W7JLJ5_HIBTR|nr:histidine-containing phosphotransfer factor 5 [Hibiscus trionum]